MKRFAVFAYNGYYPSGGMSDFESSHDTYEEAEAAVAAPRDYKRDYYDIVDMDDFE